MMPSPFPGMDPYLEAPDIWPDFHHRFATELSSVLNAELPSSYYARVEMRPEIGIIDEAEPGRPPAWKRIVPDVLVLRHARRPGTGPGGVAVAEAPARPRTEVSNWFMPEGLDATEAPIRHYFVEIRDPNQGHKLITLIEILSPSNKHPGPDRDHYEAKQRRVLESDASLIEIDLLRTGQRVLPTPQLARFIRYLSPRPDYLVLVSRAWDRTDSRLGYIGFSVGLRECLPCIPVPLRQGEPEIPLDLQYIFTRVYDSGPYRRGAIDYTRPPDPPLSGPEADWAAARLKEQGFRTPASETGSSG